MIPALRILEPGAAASLQDLGRPGLQRFGVPVSGALDTVSLAVANILAGNPPGSAAIEILAAGLIFEIEAESVTLALAGMAAGLTLQQGGTGAPARFPALQSVTARRGDMVRIPPPSSGAVSYLAVSGGFDVSPVLGSRSTYARASLGGYLGRAFLAGDRIPLCLSSSCHSPVRLRVRIETPDRLRVMRGPNALYFTPRAFETLYTSVYTVAPASDRMGLRLKGPPLEHALEGELPPQATAAGSLQVPPDGQPILLMADRQTAGGYPRIATVIGADNAAAGRLAPGMSVRFEEVSREDAVRLLNEQQLWLASLASRLEPADAQALTPEQLLSRNLIGGVTSGAAEE
jgi:5-oxoprolinase (ATP-hydrolysing) subunit C